MSIDLVLAEKLVSYMNGLVEMDRPCIGALIANRVPCNRALADHPSCQVMVQHGGFHVGLLGILNGLCGSFDDGPKKGWGAIVVEFDDPKDCVDGWANLGRFKVALNENEAVETKP